MADNDYLGSPVSAFLGLNLDNTRCMVNAEGMEKGPYPIKYDLSSCDAEPIHLIRRFQQPSILLVIGVKDKVVKAVSANLKNHLVGPPRQFIGVKWSELLDPDTVDLIRLAIRAGDFTARNPLPLPHWRSVHFPEGANLIIHQKNDLLYLEFEPRSEAASRSAFLFRIDQSLQRIQAATEEEDIFDLTVREIKELSGFDRVMLYKFDEKYNGEVIAEAREERLTSYFGLRYPHTDIPEQARALYLENQIRHIISTDPNESVDVMVSPEIGQLDLSGANNRGVSPFHLEYLQNMGVGASMSIAIIVHQKLWGLIACHAIRPKFLDFRLRSLMGFMGKVLSGHLALQQSADFRNRLLQTSIVRSRLFERMAENYNILDVLIDNQKDLLALTKARGAAIILDGKYHLVGETPSEPEVEEIANWLTERPGSYYSTNHFPREYPAVGNFSGKVAGLLSIRLSSNPMEYILWFRPEVIQTVNWGGRPDQRKEVVEGKVRLHPNLSFAKWEQTISGEALEWEAHQIDAAIALRNDIKEIIIQKYQEVKKLNQELVSAYEEMEGFSYTVSHDLKAPLRNIKGFAEILKEDYYDNLDEFGRQALDNIVGSVGKMNQFIADILSFSKTGRAEVDPVALDMNQIVEEVWRDMNWESSGVELRKEFSTETFHGDFTQVRQVVLNLISNSIKYAGKETKPWVAVSGRVENDQYVFQIRDNGIGFDMNYADRIFQIFNRLVGEKEYEGTGIGLAIVHRVVEKHGGTISVESELGRGSCFTVYFPRGGATINRPESAE